MLSGKILYFAVDNMWLQCSHNLKVIFFSISTCIQYKHCNHVTSYCSYARPAQPGPESDQAVQAVHGCKAGDWMLFGPLMYLSLFRSFSVNVLPSWLRNADQWKPDYRAVTNEKPRN